MEKFWICWVEGSTVTNSCKHNTLEKAQKESERLAKLTQNDGKRVYVFECCGASLVKSVTWEAAKWPDLPF